MIRRLLEQSVDLVPWELRNSLRDVPGVGPFQRWLVRSFLSGRDFEHTVSAGPAKGLRLRITLPDDKGLWVGTYETQFATALGNAVCPGDIAYDIGGFRGFMSGVMALAGARRVVTFEPVAANLERIAELTVLNPALPITVHPFAVGETDDEVSFEQMPEGSMGKLSESDFQSDVRGVSTLRVAMRSVDSLVGRAEIPPPNLMKVDVEGAELRVLRGAQQTLSKHRPVVFLEAHSAELAEECRALLTALEYHVANLPPLSGRLSSDGVSHIKAIPAQ